MFTGCSPQEPTQDPIVTACINSAQLHLDKEDLDGAISVLEEGLSIIDSPELLQMLENVKRMKEGKNSGNTNSTTDNQPAGSNHNIGSYIGTWAEEDIGWEFGGLILDITDTSEGSVDFALCYTQGAPASRIAEVFQTVPLDDIKGTKLMFSFEDDGWGQTGTVTLEFEQNEILCTISNVEYPGKDYPNWGFCDDYYILAKNETAHESMEYNEDEYYELYPEDQFDEEDNGNMSIEEMKKSCLMLELVYDDFVSNTSLSPIEVSSLGNKEEYINHAFVPCETLTKFIICPRCLGNGFKDGNTANGKCYNKGFCNKDKTENGIHYILQADPDQAVTRPVTISDVLTDVNGSVVYRINGLMMPTMNLYDNRPDQSIVLTKGTKIVPYMIYTGSVEYVYQFSMVDCDIIG